MNLGLEIITTWSERLLINFKFPEKQGFLIIAKRNHTGDIDILFQNQPIEFVSSHEHFGITFESIWAFSTHFDNIMQSVSKKKSVLRKLK